MTGDDSIAKIRSTLWNDLEDIEPSSMTYSTALMEQYKLYVELADRVSQRRGVANSFFLLVNSTAVVILGSLGVSLDQMSSWFLGFTTVVLILICGAWFYIVKSHSQLNSGKWKVVGVMEERLPASPWSRAEWNALGEGRDRSLYWPLTHIEKWVPLVFILLYIGMLTIALYVK